MPKSQECRGLFPGALEMMILQSLRSRPMHGYALTKHIQAHSDELLRIDEGSLYPALQRMLKEGWLKSEVGVSAKNRPVRVYRLAPESEGSSKRRVGVIRPEQQAWAQRNPIHFNIRPEASI